MIERLRAMTSGHWLSFFAALLLAWVALFALAAPADLRAAAALAGPEFWQSLCVITPDGAGYLRAALMWALMGAAMMAPTALPALVTLDDLTRGRGASARRDFGLFTLGYLLIWAGFALIAAAVQLALVQAALISPLGDSLSLPLSVGLLTLAGLYQFSALKESCLAKCRTPLTFFFQHWDEGALRMGLRQGALCLGCCWALMALGFVGGVMNLAFMGLAMVLMTLEKLPRYGARLTAPLGWALLAAALAMAVRGILGL